MTGETLWDIIIARLPISEVELQTTAGLWFKASSNKRSLYMDKATGHTPSSNLSTGKMISKRDFLFVYSYYERWGNGEIGIRQEVSRKSRNITSLFALIEKFIHS